MPVPVKDALRTVGSCAAQTTGLELTHLQRALELPDSQRAVLLPIGLEELGYDEFGKISALPSARRSRLFRSRAKLWSPWQADAASVPLALPPAGNRGPRNARSCVIPPGSAGLRHAALLSAFPAILIYRASGSGRESTTRPAAVEVC